MHELRPTMEDRRIRRKNTITLRDRIEPILDFFGLRGILTQSHLYAGLYFTDRHGGDV